MAVPTINNIQSLNASSTSNRTLAYTPTSGANSKLVVAVHLKDNAAIISITNVSYAGANLTRITGGAVGTSYNNDGELWYLDEPLDTAASGDIIVSDSDGGSILTVVIIACTVLGTAAGTPVSLEASSDTTNSGTTLSTSVTPSAADALVFSMFISGSNTRNHTATSPHSEDLELDIGGSGSDSTTSIGHEEVVSPAVTTVQWTSSGSSRLILCVCVFAAGGGTSDSAALTGHIATANVGVLGQDISGAATLVTPVGVVAAIGIGTFSINQQADSNIVGVSSAIVMGNIHIDIGIWAEILTADSSTWAEVPH